MLFMFVELQAQLSDKELSNQKTFTIWLQAKANAKKVYKLDLSNGALYELTKDIKKLKHLQKFFLENNDLENLPEELCELKNLQYFHVQKNKLKSLPLNIGNLTSLKELDLSNNPLPQSEIDRVKKALPNCKITFNQTEIDE